MNPSNPPNPEQRSNNALWVFCTGAGLCIGAYFLAVVGLVEGAMNSGGDPAVVIGSMFGVIGIVLMGVAGFVLVAVGGIWMVLRVIADQTGDNEKRYRDVNR
ncbi:MAG TPA: hypothetical protein PLS69_14605 [Terricaulis sp.]|nr:hypothetical protein [Terricaulis sp.]